MVDSIESIAERLRITREALGISPAELCRRTGLAPNRYSQYENGERRITVDAAAILCNTFGLTLDWIYRGDPSGLPVRIVQNLPVLPA